MKSGIVFASECFPSEKRKGRANTGFLVLVKSGTANVKIGKTELLLKSGDNRVEVAGIGGGFRLRWSRSRNNR